MNVVMNCLIITLGPWTRALKVEGLGSCLLGSCPAEALWRCRACCLIRPCSGSFWGRSLVLHLQLQSQGLGWASNTTGWGSRACGRQVGLRKGLKPPFVVSQAPGSKIGSHTKKTGTQAAADDLNQVSGPPINPPQELSFPLRAEEWPLPALLLSCRTSEHNICQGELNIFHQVKGPGPEGPTHLGEAAPEGSGFALQQAKHWLRERITHVELWPA